MKKLLTVLVLATVLLFPASLLAQTIRYAYTSEQITVAGTAVGFTAGKLNVDRTSVANQTTFSVSCSGGGTACILRYTIDGTTPTTTLGHRAFHGDTISISGYGNNVQFRGIRETATSVILDVTYLR